VQLIKQNNKHARTQSQRPKTSLPFMELKWKVTKVTKTMALFLSQKII